MTMVNCIAPFVTSVSLNVPSDFFYSLAEHFDFDTRLTIGSQFPVKVDLNFAGFWGDGGICTRQSPTCHGHV